jgi:uncharacterized protein YqhQ
MKGRNALAKQPNGLAPMAVGGQAVIEGVMMRAPGLVATAVRRPDGTINVRTEEHHSLADRYPILKLPVLRGALGLVEMMVIGIRTLNYSAEVSLGEQVHGKADGRDGVSVFRPSQNLKLGLTVGFALLAGISIFFALPLLLTSVLFSVGQDPFWFNLAAGAIRVVLLLGYLLVISLMRDIRRLFEYHGAEHKAVFAFELGEPLEVTATAAQSRFHPRCGTSFLLIVMLSAILLFSVIDSVMMLWLGQLTLVTRLFTHLPLIPLVGGLSYEVIRATARHAQSTLGRAIIAPGLWLQRITTREPDASQLEVALAALRAALRRTGAPESRLPFPVEPSPV